MLLIVNCKAIYGTRMPEMSGALKRMGHDLIVFGGQDDLDRGEVYRAVSALRASEVTVADFDTTEARRWAMVGIIEDHEHGMREILVISDEPRDRAAAESLNIATVSPFDFDFEHLGEEPE